MRKTAGIIVIILTTLSIHLSLQRCNSGEKITKQALGKLIFFDNSLSEPPGQSCATCHRPENGFADTLGRMTSEGAVTGLFGKRNSMSIAYTAHIPSLSIVVDGEDSLYAGGLFWDGRADSLAHQAGMPFLDKLEMANQSEEEVVMKIMKAPYYNLFCKIYGDIPVSGGNRDENIKKIYACILNALGAYQSSPEVSPYNSAFDLYLEGKYTMTEEEEKGFELFKGRGKCAECHILDKDPQAGRILFTDHTYDNLGIPKNDANRFYDMDTIHNPLGKDYIDPGLKATTGREEDLGLFRVPTLRNIEKTAPYGHNGYFATLREIVHFYNVRDVSDKFPPAECPATVNKDELGNLELTSQEEEYLVAFMKLLSDIDIPPGSPHTGIIDKNKTNN